MMVVDNEMMDVDEMMMAMVHWQHQQQAKVREVHVVVVVADDDDDDSTNWRCV
jgi:hypothetical protein